MATHHYQPSRWYTALGPYYPALTVADGDTIVTSTVDSSGRDATGRQVTPGGNPQTGPFYVEGAEPGDTLAVTLDRLQPNRSSGYSGAVLAPNVVDASTSRELPIPSLVEWTIDHERSVAVRTLTGDLPGFALPLAPMLGCFGVAPPRDQAISTATSGEHGGNMDYRGFVQGVTAYFPVFASGALFYLGDGHAAQGDGEIVGTGIEISFEVQVTLKVLKGKSIGWPRGETEDFIFTVGNARPLDQALQHATTEMLRWLREDYALGTSAASILLGQTVRYDVGNVYDPAYTMVCKVAKAVLASV